MTKQETTDEVKKKHVIEALESLGFKEAMGFYIKKHKDNLVVVVEFLESGTAVYFRDGKSKIIEDDDIGTLAKISKIITDAEGGKMPEMLGQDKQKEQPRPVPSREVGEKKPVEEQDTKEKKPTVDESKSKTPPTPQNEANTYAKMRQRKPSEMVELTIDIVKRYINEKVTDEEAYTFIQLCKARHLNPFLGQVHLTKKEYTGSARTIIGKDAFLERAEMDPVYDGFEAGIIIQLKDGSIESRPGAFHTNDEKLLGGWAKVYRKDHTYPTEARVMLSEYDTHKSSWNRIKATMVRKVPIVQAHREAFPSELSGLYDGSEMGVET